MEKTELLACPHCDGEAAPEDWKVGHESGTTVLCADCGACISESVVDGDGWHERAVEKWNRRTPSPDNCANAECPYRRGAPCPASDGCGGFVPDNNPLTVEDLQEMDGEPVWIVFDDDSETKATVDFSHVGEKLKLTNSHGVRIVFEEHKSDIKAIYRRPPEERK